jgi:hypothetical protein
MSQREPMDAIIVPEVCKPCISAQRTKCTPQKVGDENILHKYYELVLRDWLMIKNHLPQQINSIIDIGCGVAGIDVYLKRKWPDAKLWLLDGDSMDAEKMGGFCDHVINLRSATEALLRANDVSFEGWLDIGTKQPLKADLIISLASWGYHYPLKTYSVSGFCLADLRESKEKPRGKVIYKGKKYNRCAWSQ